MKSHHDQPLIPAWYDDAKITEVIDTLEVGIYTYFARITTQVAKFAPQLIAETETVLQHEAEGW